MHRSKLPLTMWFWAAHLMATHSNGMSARQLADQLGVTYKTAWLLTQKLRRSMANPNRDPLEEVVEFDQAEIPFRVGDTFLEPGNAGKILIAGAIEVIDRDTNTSKPRRKGAKYSLYTLRASPPRHDRRQHGRLYRGLRQGQCEAGSHADQRWPRVVSRIVGRLPARSAHRRQNGGTHRIAVEPSRLLAAEAMGAGYVYTACAASTSTPISMSSSFATIAGSTGMFRSRPCWASPRATNRRAIRRHQRAGQSSQGSPNALTHSPLQAWILHIDRPELTR